MEGRFLKRQKGELTYVLHTEDQRVGTRLSKEIEGPDDQLLSGVLIYPCSGYGEVFSILDLFQQLYNVFSDENMNNQVVYCLKAGLHLSHDATI